MENSDSESLKLRGLANLPRRENGASIVGPWKKNEALYRIGFLFTSLPSPGTKEWMLLSSDVGEDSLHLDCKGNQTN